MRKTLRWTALLLSMLLLLCSCGKTTEPEVTDSYTVIGFSQVGAESDWRAANTASMITSFSEENGYRLILDDAQQKPERQITAIRNFIQMGVDYIVLAPTREIGWETVLSEAKAAGIPVIIVDRMIVTNDDSLFTCWVGSDFLKEGQTAVKWIEDTYPNAPLRIAHLQGNIGSSAQLGRTNALDEALETHSDWSLTAREAGDFTQAKAQEIIEEWLHEGIEFDIIYSENDNMSYGAIDALKEAGLVPGKDVIIVSFDATQRAMKYVLSGEISYEVECNPLHGPRVLSLIEALAAGKAPAKLSFVEETSFSACNLTEERIAERQY